jgi:hypothetical protein
VWFAWGAENDEIEVPKKSAETGGHRQVKQVRSLFFCSWCSAQDHMLARYRNIPRVIAFSITTTINTPRAMNGYAFNFLHCWSISTSFSGYLFRRLLIFVNQRISIVYHAWNNGILAGWRIPTSITSSIIILKKIVSATLWSRDEWSRRQIKQDFKKQYENPLLGGWVPRKRISGFFRNQNESKWSNSYSSRKGFVLR